MSTNKFLVLVVMGIITLTTLVVMVTINLVQERTHQKLEPSISEIRMKRITCDTWICTATFIGLTSETITPTIEAHVSFKKDPIARVDSVHHALVGDHSRRFEWMLEPEEWEKGGDISSPCLRVKATTLDSEGHEHKVSSPFIDFQVR